jgi:outer membrane protein, multidrug efflux system
VKRLTLLAALLPIGCALGPNYHRPALDVPGKYREVAPPAESEPMDVVSMGDSGWRQVYSDPNLQALLDSALKNNFDVKTALARIDEARAELGSTRLYYLPASRGWPMRPRCSCRPPGSWIYGGSSGV